jgi:hypothetical protein
MLLPSCTPEKGKTQMSKDNARKRIRAALKTRADLYQHGQPPDALATYLDEAVRASDIEQILAENRALRGACKAFHKEIGSLNTRLAAAQAQQVVVIPAPEKQTQELPAGVDAGISLLMKDLGQMYEPEAAGQHLRRVREVLAAREQRIAHLEEENRKLKDRLPTKELAHAISDRNAYRSALLTCARHASGDNPTPGLPTPDNLQGVVCRALSRAKDVEAAIRGALA